MRVDFFRFEKEDGPLLAAALAISLKLPNNEKRTHVLGKIPFRLRKLANAGRYWDGDMIRINMHDIPLKVRMAGQESDVELQEDEGLGATTAFRYDEQTQVLAIQVSKSGVAASKLSAFFDAHTTTKYIMTPVQVKEQNPGGAVAKLEQVRRVHIRYTGVLDAGLVASPLDDVQTGIDKAADTAPVMEMTISMGREKGSLPLKWAKQFILAAYERSKSYVTGQAKVERIDVIGTFDDEAAAKLNLLEYFMTEEVEVESDPKTKRMSYVHRQSGIEEAWKRRLATLERMFARRS